MTTLDLSKSSSCKTRTGSLWAWLALAIITAVFAAIRIRLLQLPLERDEGEYAYMGQLMLHGVPPYLQAYNMKFPGIYAAYALIMAIFGQSTGGIHFGLVLTNAATTVLLFALARRVLDDYAAVVTAAVYAFLSIGPPVLGITANAEHFILLPAIGGVLLLRKAIDSKQFALLPVSGLLLGLAVVVKQQGLLFAAFGMIYLLYSEICARPMRLVGSVRRVAVFSLALAVPFGIACLALLATGAFSQFWLWTIKYSHDYGSLVSRSEALSIFRAQTPLVVMPSIWLWVFAGVGLTAIAWERRARANWFFLLAFAVFSFLAVCPGFYFRPHYYILMLPAGAVLAGVAVSCGRQAMSRISPRRVWRCAPVALFALAFAFSVGRQSEFLFRMSPMKACRSLYGANPFPESLAIARYIGRRTSPSDCIAILGSEPQICFYANRRMAAGYIYMCPLMEKQPRALSMQRDMIRQIESRRPKYLVMVNEPGSWRDLRNPWNYERLLFDWIEAYTEANYQQVGLIDIPRSLHTRYYWDGGAVGRESASEHSVYVFRRKA